MIDLELTPGILPVDAGKLVYLAQLGVRYVSRGEQAGGRVAIVEYLTPPHALGAPVHTHTREDEISYVVEGVVGIQIGDDVYSAGPGVTIFKPRGIPHTFWNATDAPSRVLEILTPAGFEGYFEEMAALFAEAKGGMPDPERAGAVMAKYGVQMDFGSIPVLAQRYGLRL
ncbi:MAG TPA: cupin domain-containing protein [Ktedonobacterales bacterium]|nr:cupin domain-containing protein [Ktedonobacterales bacterium]